MATGIFTLDDLEAVMREMESRYGEKLSENTRALLRRNTQDSLHFGIDPDRLEFSVRASIQVVMGKE